MTRTKGRYTMCMERRVSSSRSKAVGVEDLVWMISSSSSLEVVVEVEDKVVVADITVKEVIMSTMEVMGEDHHLLHLCLITQM